MVSQADRKAWYSNPVTQQLLKDLHGSRQNTMEHWAREGYIGNSAEQSSLMNAKALGGMQMLDDLISLIEEHKQDNQDEQPKGVHDDTTSY